MIDNQLSNVNSTAFCITLMMGMIMFAVPRRMAAIPVLVVAAYITLGQVIHVSSFNFTLLRITLLFAWGRLLLFGDLLHARLNEIDKALLSWVTVSFLLHNLLWRSGSALVNQLGFAYNTIGLYFLFRIFLSDIKDATLLLRAVAVVVVPLAIAMLAESLTGRNIFALFGGVPVFSEVRHGVVRAQGSFDHPILAGTFGASLVAPFLGLLFTYRRYRLVAIAGIAASTTITLTSGSVGPLFTYCCGVAGMIAWFFRRHLKWLLALLAMLVVGAQVALNAPVWHLFGTLGEVTGGTGGHRSELIDQAIAHFGEWWLMGTRYTGHWMTLTLEEFPDKADITNHFIAIGVNGGMPSLILFVTFVALSFRGVGRIFRLYERQASAYQYLVWSLGVGLVANCVSMMSVCYFDQIIVFWYLQMAVISSLYTSVIRDETTKAESPARLVLDGTTSGT